MFRSHAIRALALLLASALAVGGATTYPTPNLDSTPVGEAKPVWLGGVKFVNKGLVGVGQLAVGALDDRGDSLGSFSSFKIDPKTWRRHPDGSYGGTLFTLPDRGYNVHGTVDYPARLQRFELTFRPDYGRDPVLTPNLKLVFKATRTLLDFKGNVTTGLDPHEDTLQGFSPVPVRHGKFAVDAEGLGLHPDGTFYLSDEYGATIFHLSPHGRMRGLLTPPNAFLPRFEAKKFSGFTTDIKAVEVQTGGRRDNQGYEGVDVTPDGRYLVAMLQGALRQDCPTEEENNRAYARLVVYDLQPGSTPHQPVGHYLIELPTFNTAGLGKPANKAAAQSELMALSRTDFLILARDSSGSGSGKSDYAPEAAAVGYAAAPHIYKSVLLVSTRAATNLVGTTYESGYVPAVRGSGPTLAPAYGLTAATGTEFVNLLNPVQLARFGLDLNAVGPAGVAKAAAEGHRVGVISPASLSAKWEALAIVSCLDRAYPDDYFLLVGNDNDFLTAEGTMLGKSYNATSPQPGMEIVETPNRILVYRVTLPGYAPPVR